MKIFKIQIGFEVWDKGKRATRLTPLDLEVKGNPLALSFLQTFLAGFDMLDGQPGDGEVDIPLPAKMLQHPLIRKVVPDDAEPNVFIKLTVADSQAKAKPAAEQAEVAK